MIALLFAHTSGELSEALGNLANLTVLDVSSNALTGAAQHPAYMPRMFC